MSFFETTFANSWNRCLRCLDKQLTGGLDLGLIVTDGRLTNTHYFLPYQKLTESVEMGGTTGSGKTSVIVWMFFKNFLAGHSSVVFDHHGDTIPRLLSFIAAEEERTGKDLSDSLIVIEPADPDLAVGINILPSTEGPHLFVAIAALVTILVEKFGLLGAPTQEVLRNTVYALAASRHTIVEAPLFLSHRQFRSNCLKHVTNPEIIDYFEQRFEPLSEAMKAQRRDPVLNKLSEFIADPHFRHVLGQVHSTVSFVDALDNHKTVLINLAKGRLGPHSSTLGSLLLSQIIAAVFRRQSRDLALLFLDEAPNLLVEGSHPDVLLAQSRKFSVGSVLSYQFSEQLPASLREALGAAGTHIFFQLSANDAQNAAAALSGGKVLADLLKNLEKRHCVIKSGHYGWQQVEVPLVDIPKANYQSLLERSRARYARKRSDIEAEIRSRRPKPTLSEKDSLHDWD